MDKESILKELIDNILSLKISKLVKDEMYEEFKNGFRLKFKEYITSQNTKNMLYSLVEEKMLQAEKDNKSLKSILPPGFENSLKVLVYNKGPEITEAVKGFINNEKFKNTIRVEINKFVSGMGPMVAKFVNVDNIYNKIMQSIMSYVQKPETMMSIISGINNKIDEGSAKNLSDFSNSIPYEGKLSLIRKLVDSFTVSIAEDSFIHNVEINIEKKLLKYDTIGELLQDFGIDNGKLGKALYTIQSGKEEDSSPAFRP